MLLVIFFRKSLDANPKSGSLESGSWEIGKLGNPIRDVGKRNLGSWETQFAKSGNPIWGVGKLGELTLGSWEPNSLIEYLLCILVRG